MNQAHDFFTDTWISLRRTFRLLARNKSGMIGIILLIIIILVSFAGPLFVKPVEKANVKEIYQGPSWQHPLGTDFQGKDNLVQVVYGGKDIMIVAFLAGLMTTFFAVVIGALAAFVGGLVDSLLMQLVDIWLTIPQFPLLAVVATLIKLDSPWLLALLLALLSWPGLARQIRAQVLSLRRREYVEAASALDLGTPHIIFRELLPNMMSYIAISLVFSMTSAIYQQTGLVFLGLVPFSSANWGVMLSLAYAKGAMFQVNSAWNIISPILAIALFELSLVMLARSLDELFDPRLRTEV